MAQRIIKYRHIREGYGGISSPDTEPFPIGTRNCRTCVGVYFPVSEEKCFAAHINACMVPSDYDNTPWAKFRHAPRVCETPEEEDGVRKLVYNQLEQAAQAEGWTAADVEKSKVIVVCSEYNGKPIAGKSVVEAIKAFLQVDELAVHDDCHGFVMDPSRSQPILMPYKGFDASLDEGREMVNAVWQQEISGDEYHFEAEDIPDSTKGPEPWLILLKENVVSMAQRKDKGKMRALARNYQ